MAQNPDTSKEAMDTLKKAISDKAALLTRLYDRAAGNTDSITTEKKIAVVEQILERLNDDMARRHYALYEDAIRENDPGEVEHHLAHYLGYEALSSLHSNRHGEALERIRELEADRA